MFSAQLSISSLGQLDDGEYFKQIKSTVVKVSSWPWLRFVHFSLSPLEPRLIHNSARHIAWFHGAGLPQSQLRDSRDQNERGKGVRSAEDFMACFMRKKRTSQHKQAENMQHVISFCTQVSTAAFHAPPTRTKATKIHVRRQS